jgi:hypothetical protein
MVTSGEGLLSRRCGPQPLKPPLNDSRPRRACMMTGWAAWAGGTSEYQLIPRDQMAARVGRDAVISDGSKTGGRNRLPDDRMSAGVALFTLFADRPARSGCSKRTRCFLGRPGTRFWPAESPHSCSLAAGNEVPGPSPTVDGIYGTRAVCFTRYGEMAADTGGEGLQRVNSSPFQSVDAPGRLADDCDPKGAVLERMSTTTCWILFFPESTLAHRVAFRVSRLSAEHGSAP